MPQLPDFLNSPLMRDQLQRQYNDPYKTGVDSYLKGYQQAYAPQMMQQEAEMGRLQNALNKAKEPYAAEGARLENEMKKAQVQQALRQAMSGNETTGDVRNYIEVARMEHELGANHPQVIAAKRALTQQESKNEALQEYRKGISESRDWSSMGAAAKENTLAMGRGIAPEMTDNQLTQFFKSGGTYQDLANQVGMSPQQLAQVTRQFAAPNATINAINQSKGAEAELNTMNNFITDSLKDFSGDQFAGYSLSQIIGSFSNKPEDIDKQARFLAGRALAAEQSAIRARLAGASNAEGALKELKELSLNSSKIFRPMVSSKVYEKMQHHMDKVLSEAAHARFKAMAPQAKVSSAAQKEAEGGYDNDPLDYYKSKKD